MSFDNFNNLGLSNPNNLNKSNKPNNLDSDDIDVDGINDLGTSFKETKLNDKNFIQNAQKEYEQEDIEENNEFLEEKNDSYKTLRKLNIIDNKYQIKSKPGIKEIEDAYFDVNNLELNELYKKIDNPSFTEEEKKSFLKQIDKALYQERKRILLDINDKYLGYNIQGDIKISDLLDNILDGLTKKRNRLNYDKNKIDIVNEIDNVIETLINIKAEYAELDFKTEKSNEYGKVKESVFFSKIKSVLGENFYAVRAHKYDDYCNGCDVLIYYQGQDKNNNPKDTVLACFDVGNRSSKIGRNKKDVRDDVRLVKYLFHDYKEDTFYTTNRKNTYVFNVDFDEKNHNWFVELIKNLQTQRSNEEAKVSNIIEELTKDIARSQDVLKIKYAGYKKIKFFNEQPEKIKRIRECLAVLSTKDTEKTDVYEEYKNTLNDNVTEKEQEKLEKLKKDSEIENRRNRIKAEILSKKLVFDNYKKLDNNDKEKLCDAITTNTGIKIGVAEVEDLFYEYRKINRDTGITIRDIEKELNDYNSRKEYLERLEKLLEGLSNKK